MNDCVDDAWFGTGNKDEHVFDSIAPIAFPDGKTWRDYVVEDRLEITCGEAPYIASRYDATTGEPIAVPDRYGILDRKLRIVSENVEDEDEWIEWAKTAYKHTYGYEWQGDSLLLARENVLATAIDHFHAKFGGEAEIPASDMVQIAEIVSWNIWQMDGLKLVVPDSCGKVVTESESLFSEEPQEQASECVGCIKNCRDAHNGIYCVVMDWDEGRPARFVDLFE